MNIHGKTIEVEFEINVPKNGGGSYLGTTLTFKDNQGKVQTKSWVQTALNHASNAHIKAALQALTKGTCFEAESVKNDKGFWNWTDLKIVSGEDKKEVSKPAQSSGGGGNWQTAEERAQTQLHIIRQNSLGHAVNLYTKLSDINIDDTSNAIEYIISFAKEFEQHVLGIREEPKTLENMENDLV